MQVLIDNLDGRGAVDYSGAIAVEGRVLIERKLNAPSRCTFTVVEGADGVMLPVRRARVIVTSGAEDATVLFTGYITTEPVRDYAGTRSEGSAYRAKVTAVSDEWLLDRAGSGAAPHDGISLALDGRTLLERLTSRVQGTGLSVASGGAARSVGAFTASDVAPWSSNAGLAASAAFAGYRAVAGQVLLTPAGAVTHAFSDADGTLDVSAFHTANLRELANDITVSGEMEPAAIVSELFIGDGTTAAFTLSESAFRNSKTTLIDDSFEGSAFDPATWAVSDPGVYLGLSSAGLTISGGNGFDGHTTLSALDALEMGGTLVIELGSVLLGPASDGMLAGLYKGSSTLADCFAGFRVRQSTSGTGGVTVLVPVLNGAEVGSVFTPVAGHKYTLRLRLHCVEMYRLQQRYYAMVDGVVETFGSNSGIDAPMDVVFELVDQGDASNAPATVLYDSAAATPVAVTPATCAFVVANSTHLVGSVGRVRVTRPGSLWITGAPTSGPPRTQLMGVAGEGVDCQVQYGAATKITFFDGRIPVPNERILVQYRRERRSVARLVDAASLALEALGGGDGTCRWLGRVSQPIARTSVDCESAAAALLAMATSRSASIAGTYIATNPEDIWPGDVLQITSGGTTTPLLVRSVAVSDAGAAPEVVRYRIGFANGWAAAWEDGLGLRVAEQIAADAVLPTEPELTAGNALPSLQGLRITGVTTTTLSLDAGITPPVGGGFEVRRRDAGFGPGSDGDLVLRSPVGNFSISRAAQVERYFVRTYDASVPPVYSRFSSAVFVTAPVA